MFDVLREVALDEEGVTAIEYGLIAVLISLAGMAAFTSLSNKVNGMFGYVLDMARSAGF